jgi:hypothetical protein
MLVNGSPFGIFSSTHGVKQGDPISAFMFVIVMEAFSRMITATIGNGHLSGFSMGPSPSTSINISHLLFEYDTLVFCGANSDHIRSLQVLFICFEAVSGLKVNMAKLMLVPMGNVDNTVELVGILGCGTSSLPLKYLGLPLGAHFKEKSSWDGIVGKINR